MAEQTLSRPWYVIIEGAIGVGKTTLARMLSERLHTGLLLEVFEENPFLARFYEARAQYAFQTQMFFLLSRYRQQQRVPGLLQQGALFSDYMFNKDWLFAELNLAGDEWEIYQQMHTALAGQVVRPDLIVYLQADTDVLMGRITQRDRPYERAMDRDYIESLRQAYERFFLKLADVSVLTIDTDRLNFVTSLADLQLIIDRIRSELRDGLYQQPLPTLETAIRQEDYFEHGRPLSDYQRFHEALDKVKGFNTDVYFNYLCLIEEMGKVSRVLTELWREETSIRTEGQTGEEARQRALQNVRNRLEEEMADCMAYLLKMANYSGIDLESAYLEKMKGNQKQLWS